MESFTVTPIRSVADIAKLAYEVRTKYDLTTPIDYEIALPAAGLKLNISNAQVLVPDIVLHVATVRRCGYEASLRLRSCHALGHFLMHMDGESTYVDSRHQRKDYARETWEADIFSYALTMPEAEYRCEFAKLVGLGGGPTLTALTKHFGVPIIAVIEWGREIGVLENGEKIRW